MSGVFLACCCRGAACDLCMYQNCLTGSPRAVLVLLAGQPRREVSMEQIAPVMT